jgi:CHC2 zinc finger/Toprim-like
VNPIDSEVLENCRARLPEYLSKTGIEFHKNGSRLVARCPVHEDRSPSFAVFGEGHEVCGCYPCGFTGDIFAASQWLGRSSTFPQAVADVAAALGISLPQSTAGTTTRRATPPPRPVKQPEPPFVLSDAERGTVHAARLAFSDAFHAGEPIVDDIAASLGLDRETLRLASWGSCGLGLADGWLCYIYPQGLKWRNPDPSAKCRFRWIVGKALAPWRMEWVKPETEIVYLTEGESDCMALIAAGLEADGTAVCVASPGTSFPRGWAPLFQGRRVILCFDTDPPGRTATATVAAILKGHASEILTWKGTTSHV